VKWAPAFAGVTVVALSSPVSSRRRPGPWA